MRHFDADYRETTTLHGGEVVVLRLITPEDKAELAAGLARMSPKARFMRFLHRKDELTAAELRYLTEVDGERHFALGAARLREDGSEEGIGVGRFVQIADEPEVAEAAIVVIDDYQRHGLGRILFLRLVAAARERGIRCFRSEVLGANRAMRKLVHKLVPEAEEHADGNLITVVAELPQVDVAEEPDTPSGRGANYRLLALAAGRTVQVRPPSSDPGDSSA